LDLIDIGDKKREVSEKDAENFCEDNKIECVGECSAKKFTDKELKDIFIKCWRIFVEKFWVKKYLQNMEKQK